MQRTTALSFRPFIYNSLPWAVALGPGGGFAAWRSSPSFSYRISIGKKITHNTGPHTALPGAPPASPYDGLRTFLPEYGAHSICEGRLFPSWTWTRHSRSPLHPALFIMRVRLTFVIKVNGIKKEQKSAKLLIAG